MSEKLRDLLKYSETLKRKGAIKHHPSYPLLVEETNFLPPTCTVSRRLWHIRNEKPIPKCKVCDNDAAWDNKEGGYYRQYCSNKCAVSDPDRMKKIQKTNKQRYGSSSPFGASEVRKKSAETVRRRYGVDNVSQYNEINVRRKRSIVNSKNKNIDQLDKIVSLISDNCTQTEIGNELGISQPRVSALLQRLDLKTQKRTWSTGHQEIIEFLKDQSVSFIVNDRTCISPHELDIFLPEYNLAIEFNGIYWHSELAGKTKRYHVNKTNSCRNKGIDLIHIFSNEWERKRDIVKSRLLYKLKKIDNTIYARKCVIQEIPVSIADKFVALNHIQGSRSASINIGAFFENKLVAVMTFSKHPGQFQYEIVRSCSLTNVNVVGVISRMFAFFKRKHAPISVLTYADSRWGNGAGYSTIGFNFDGYTPPNYWYFKRNGDTNRLHSRIMFQKHKLSRVLPTFSVNKTEWENMVDNGYDRIWDCGSSRWIWYP